MSVFKIISGLRNRLHDLKETSPLYLIHFLLIISVIFIFRLTQFLKVRLIVVNYPRSFYIIKVRENVGFWNTLILNHWETHGFITLKQIIKKGDIIFDVGAWNGVYTMYLSKSVGKKGRVYTFEPDPMALQLLKTNIKFNKLNNILVENVAVSNSEGKESLHLLSDGGNSESFLNKAQGTNREKITTKKLKIKTTSLDNYCKENSIIPNGIKIDVEGAEPMVFQGLKNIISKYRPWIMLEFHGRFMNDEERYANWKAITKDAKKVIFIGGICKIQYKYGEDIKNKTAFLEDDYSVIHVLIYY